MNKGRMLPWACGPLLLALLLSACGEQTTPSAEEHEQLDNASEMLDSAPNALADIDDNSLGQPERNSTEPAN
ncbi:MAG: hypothetical protein ACR2JJ_00625 [Sphingomicrobium sp.]